VVFAVAAVATVAVVIRGEFVRDVLAAGRECGVDRLYVSVVEIIARGGAARSVSRGLDSSRGLDGRTGRSSHASNGASAGLREGYTDGDHVCVLSHRGIGPDVVGTVRP
jgi:hypothetical protein